MTRGTGNFPLVTIAPRLWPYRHFQPNLGKFGKGNRTSMWQWRMHASRVYNRVYQPLDEITSVLALRVYTLWIKQVVALKKVFYFRKFRDRLSRTYDTKKSNVSYWFNQSEIIPIHPDRRVQLGLLKFKLWKTTTCYSGKVIVRMKKLHKEVHQNIRIKTLILQWRIS